MAYRSSLLHLHYRDLLPGRRQDVLCKHRHHISQRPHGFCANLALGCRQYRPYGSGLSSQKGGEERKAKVEEHQLPDKCCPLVIRGLRLLAPLRPLDRACGKALRAYGREVARVLATSSENASAPTACGQCWLTG